MCVHRSYWLGLLLVAALAPLPGQVYPPGQYPGQYPPGGYPGGTGGVGFPFPHRKNKKNTQDQAELQSFEGMLRRIEKEQVILESDDHRILTCRRTDRTKFVREGEAITAAELMPGDHVVLEASQDDQGFLTAVNVIWQQDGSRADRKRAAEPVETSPAKSSGDEDRPVLRRADAQKADAPKEAPPAVEPPKPAAQTAQASTLEEPNPADLNAPVQDKVPAERIDPGDEGPPVLKRGKAATRQPAEQPTLTARNTPRPSEAEENADEEEVQPQQPAVRRVSANPHSADAVIEQAREAAGNFLEGLPNYVCQEYMTRYVSGSHPVSWQPQDIVSTDLVYEDGHEHYRNIAINGKVTKKSMEELPGSWSTGEFGTVLAQLFSPATEADFHYRRESRSGGRTALLFDFAVDREHSAWRIMVASQMVVPAYTGSVWIDKETKRVLRIEMQAARLPEAFPADKVESATDYEFVRFADRQFLVPVRAETLSCQRGTDNCSRNTIDFRNYHKYSGESTITFGN